ncbi:MAG: dihydroorotate dehydrogenase electron transfer subunit [Nitriliruptoraceae bacterium]
MTARRAGVVVGRETGPVNVTCEVLERRKEGAYWRLVLSARTLAGRSEPGQFVQVAVEGQHTLLRRPFSIARATRQGAEGGTLEVVFDAHGPGTEWLTRCSPHDVLDVIGPLGTPFPLPKRDVGCVLVGGGYGSAPLYWLGETLNRMGLRVDSVIGAASGERLHGVMDAKRVSASATFTTDDGSYGTQGRVTDVLGTVIERSGAQLLYACGPNPMLAAVTAVAKHYGIAVQVAVEEKMACGTGVCFTCVLPVRDKTGTVTMRRACLEGPVFDGTAIAWDESRYNVSSPVETEAVDD